MKVTVMCDNCSDPINWVEMKCSGPLYLNQDTKSQSQEYKCEQCKHTVTVIIEIG